MALNSVLSLHFTIESGLKAPRLRYHPRKELESSSRRKEVTIQLNYLTALREMIVCLMPPYHSKIKNTAFESYSTTAETPSYQARKEQNPVENLGVYENPPFLGQGFGEKEMRGTNTYQWTYPSFPRGGGRGERTIQMAVGSLGTLQTKAHK